MDWWQRLFKKNKMTFPEITQDLNSVAQRLDQDSSTIKKLILDLEDERLATRAKIRLLDQRYIALLKSLILFQDSLENILEQVSEIEQTREKLQEILIQRGLTETKLVLVGSDNQPINSQLDQFAFERLGQILKEIGVEEIPVKVGQDLFDAGKGHQGSGLEDSLLPEGTITKVVRNGYLWRIDNQEIIIRPIEVIVSSGKTVQKGEE
jgi:molecular chaperone GrpE (heat shock protein)